MTDFGIPTVTSDKCYALDPWVRRVLDSMGVEEAFVSDRSVIDDFVLEAVQGERLLKIMRKELKVPVERTDPVWVVADRLRQTDRFKGES